MRQSITFTVLVLLTSFFSFSQEDTKDLQQLVGEWKLDMSPQDSTDSNFAMMRIDKITPKSVEGTFYREGVKMREGRVNTQLDVIYVALISGDNSGDYNTTFYYKNGKLYGSTHSIKKDFLAVWIAEKIK
ncbi:hypothetical protein [Aquimarina litoralis]|uniref:hypothetical protein n=1 Tax=Aquimarina litoralis TaxID=584605 RepID=UPI001C599BFF|nr:hypothetical protein [Aquimarina litoralis]MBW1295435.1 hypothetical protein [Aquimarina litoralis]